MLTTKIEQNLRTNFRGISFHPVAITEITINFSHNLSVSFLYKSLMPHVTNLPFPSTVKPQFTVPRFTGSLDLPGLNSIPENKLCV